MIASLILPIEDSQILLFVFPYSVEIAGFLSKPERQEKHEFIVDLVSDNIEEKKYFAIDYIFYVPLEKFKGGFSQLIDGKFKQISVLTLLNSSETVFLFSVPVTEEMIKKLKGQADFS
jgi:hypothetical protein